MNRRELIKGVIAAATAAPLLLPGTSGSLPETSGDAEQLQRDMVLSGTAVAMYYLDEAAFDVVRYRRVSPFDIYV